MYKNRKTLIVDDEEKARLYLANILSELHPELEIQLAASPTEALFLIKKNCYDLVFFDVEMPGMTGLDLVAEMQTSLKNVPVIFVSAYKRAEFIQRALRLNAVDYLDKPVDPTELDNALKKVFENKPYIVLASGSNNSKRFFLLTDIDERFVESDEILCFQSSKRYSIAYFTDNTNRIIRSNLTNLSGKIPKDCFLQISRQFIVNLKYVKCISKSLKEITLKGGIAELKVQKVFPRILNVLIMNNRIKN